MSIQFWNCHGVTIGFGAYKGEGFYASSKEGRGEVASKLIRLAFSK